MRADARVPIAGAGTVKPKARLEAETCVVETQAAMTCLEESVSWENV